jgi:hypothetical protein
MNKELKFFHITKCAGTSIENAGINKNIKWGRFHKEYGMHWHRIFFYINVNIIKKYDWFMVVRNPYERILSEYYCIWGGIGDKNKYKNEHTKEEMNSFIINKIKNRSLKGNHYTEQSRYLYSKIKIHILKFENLTEDFNNLMKLYNIENVVLEKDNYATEKKYKIYDFSKELIDLINQIYDKDFENFGYEKINII